MNTIDTAPRFTPVYIRSEDHPDYGEHLMHLDGRGRWIGNALTPMGPVRVTWDTVNFPGPTHWRLP